MWEQPLQGEVGGVGTVVLTDAPDGTIHGIDAASGEVLWTVTSVDGLAGYGGTEDGFAIFLLQPATVRTIELATGATPFGPLDAPSRDGVSLRDRVARTSYGLASDFGDTLDPFAGTWTQIPIEQLGGANDSTSVTGVALASGLLILSDEGTGDCPA